MAACHWPVTALHQNPEMLAKSSITITFAHTYGQCLTLSVQLLCMMTRLPCGYEWHQNDVGFCFRLSDDNLFNISNNSFSVTLSVWIFACVTSLSNNREQRQRPMHMTGAHQNDSTHRVFRGKETVVTLFWRRKTEQVLWFQSWHLPLTRNNDDILN